ncbi:hypothetical protein, partial [uncultured Eubacterium sp.]
TEPPDAEPHVRWCERSAAKSASYSIINEERRKQSMINPAAAMKVMKAKNQFVSNHPKFAAFFRNVLTGGVQEGTVIEITVTRPGEEPMTTNMRVQQSDIELFQSLKDLNG